jgi:hypothetical protein
MASCSTSILLQSQRNVNGANFFSGTPTSTTTSLSALSTTAIKDGHRGHLHLGATSSRGHAHNPSTTSLEAERNDRISRLAGLERVSTLRAPPQHPSGLSPQTTPTSVTGGSFPNNYNAYQTGGSNPPFAASVAPAYFDANGQPTAAAKMSTVGSASATESYVGEGDDVRTQTEDQDEDMLSLDTDTNYGYREAADSVASMGQDADVDAIDEDLATRSIGGYEDRMSDDGSASLVGFGEGAGSTVSGPIYHRKPLPGMIAPGPLGAGVPLMERTNSGLSGTRDRDVPMGSDTPVSAAAMQERRDARMVDGVAPDGAGVPDDEMFVDTTTRSPVPVAQLTPQQQLLLQQQLRQAAQSQHQALLQQQQQHQQLQQGLGQQQGPGGSSTREAAERIVRERLDGGEGKVGTGASALGSPGKSGGLGKFYFEER